MGSTPKAPTPPAALPEAAQLPTAPATTTSSVAADRKRRQGGSTILTSSRGTTESGATATKTLLGQ